MRPVAEKHDVTGQRADHAAKRMQKFDRLSHDRSVSIIAPRAVEAARSVGRHSERIYVVDPRLDRRAGG